jgi:hypothetical protein
MEGEADDLNNKDAFVVPPDIREQEVRSAIQDQLRAKRYSMPHRAGMERWSGRGDGPPIGLQSTLFRAVFVPKSWNNIRDTTLTSK